MSRVRSDGTTDGRESLTVLERLAAAVEQLSPDRRVIVAIDGPDAAGKTTLAETLAGRLNRPALRVSVDDWHNPRAVRHRRGDESPHGYYLDSFDYESLTEHLLLPYRAGADQVQTGSFDFRADAASIAHTQMESPYAALLLDGVFLLRPELRQHWDLSIYLHVPESVTVARALVRDSELLGGPGEVQRRYEQRYLPAHALYREAASPFDHADIVLDNSDPLNPEVVRWPNHIVETR
ncbi:MAG: uridine kinase [Actinomycetota bacterium]|nr:uridine kinase [Actinomycetota bacterium]